MGAVLSCISTNLCECAVCLSCSICSSFISSTLGQAVRFGYLLIFITLMLFASIMGGTYQSSLVSLSSSNTSYYGFVSVPNSLNLDNLVKDCDSNSMEECIYNQIIYRASFVLMLFFIIMGCVGRFSDSANKGLWSLKFFGAFGCFIGMWWGDNSFYSSYAEVARVLSFFWLLVQGLLMLDIAHDAHDIVLHKADAESVESGGSSNLWKLFYLITSSAFLTCGIVGLNYLWATPGGYTGCSTGMAFVVIGVIISISQLFISALNSVNRGVLTPCIMFSYATFMTWYSLLSSPDIECNPSAYLGISNSSDKKAARVIVIALSIFLLMFCVVAGTRIMQIFSTSGDGVLESAYGGYGTNDTETELTTGINPENGHGGVEAPKSAGSIGFTERDGNNNGNSNGSGLSEDGNPKQEESAGNPKEVMFFHFLMGLASCYSAMVLSSWGKSNGASEAVGDYSFVGSESMWLKIISLWLFYLMYYKALHLASQLTSK